MSRSEETLDEALASVDEMCRTDPACARVRMALLRLEKRINVRGWDQPPELYSALRHPDGSVYFELAEPLTDSLRVAMEVFGGDASKALCHLARFTADVGAPLFRLLHRKARSEDIEESAFYGYAFACEAWAPSRRDRSAAEEAELARVVRGKRLHEIPDRVETRFIQFVPRDGLLWMVNRDRDSAPFVLAHRPEAAFQMAGLVPNALARMTAAVVGNPVPVPPTAEQQERDFFDAMMRKTGL